jgi:DNA uptake protein ComE-like DNA-binding protein
MKGFLRDFFSFSSLERKGVLVLIIIILIITFVNFYLAHYKPKTEFDEHTSLIKELREFEQQLKFTGEDENTQSHTVNEDPVSTAELFYFDPNQASSFDLRRLGLNDRLIRTLLNYRRHGGKFYSTEDLKKIYGLSPWQYEQLAPYVKIDNLTGVPAEKVIEVHATMHNPVNINIADSADLVKLPGIGPVLARRIVRYRTLLGGFYAPRQLTEVYGITDSLFVRISIRVSADTAVIRKLNLNLATEKELARHPYIGKYMARGIIDYRSFVGRIKSLDELSINGLITAKDLEILKKYLLI